MSDKPTIVLVHGAFADASSWNGVVPLLQQRGYTVQAAANPLRGVHIDSEYIASVLSQIEGPILLVGHSYGGAVISNAASKSGNVAGLVFVAAFAPDEGETVGAVSAESKDSVLNSALLVRTYPGPHGEATQEFYDVCGPAAWRTLPSWAVVATGDRAAGADLVWAEAQRAGATITEVAGSHVIMISQPQIVVDVIVQAAETLAKQPAGAKW